MEPIIIPPNIYSDLKKAIDSQKNESDFIATPRSFTDWFEGGDYDPYDDIEASIDFAVWNIFETLENKLDDIMYELGDAYRSRSKSEILNELVKYIEEIDPDMGETPSIHTLPVIIMEKQWYILGIFNWALGGFYPDWIGLFKDPLDCINYLKNEGWYSIDEKPDAKTIENWFLNQKN